MVITFADISHYQSDVDLVAYRAAGYDRVVMKATGGARDGSLRFVDNTFADRWAQAGELGLARVAYHFARNNNHGGQEFDWFWSQVQAAGGLGTRDRLCYDQEDNRTNAMLNLARQRTIEFTQEAVRAGITQGLYYSGKWFTGPARIVASDLPPGWRKFWISDTTPDTIELPAGWTQDQVVAVQFTDHANLPGIPSTDANRVVNDWLPKMEEDLSIVDAETKAYLDNAFALLMYGDDRDPAKDKGTHPDNLQAITSAQKQLRTDVATFQSKVDQLQTMLARTTDTVVALSTKVDQFLQTGGQFDTAALVKAINDDAAKRLEA